MSHAKFNVHRHNYSCFLCSSLRSLLASLLMTGSITFDRKRCIAERTVVVSQFQVDRFYVYTGMLSVLNLGLTQRTQEKRI